MQVQQARGRGDAPAFLDCLLCAPGRAPGAARLQACTVEPVRPVQTTVFHEFRRP